MWATATRRLTSRWSAQHRTLRHYPSFTVTLCESLLLSVTIGYSPSVTIRHYPSLSVTVRYHPLLCFTVRDCPSLQVRQFALVQGAALLLLGVLQAGFFLR
jgi:hypothetical protein